MTCPTEEEFSFNLDCAFGPSASQEAVYLEVGEFVQSALDGANVCVFAYGSKGSGKTHTMLGGAGDMCGVVPRALARIGAFVSERAGEGWQYSVHAALLEVCGDQVLDLRNRRARVTATGADLAFVLDIHESAFDPTDAVQVAGLMTQWTAQAGSSVVLSLQLSGKRGTESMASRLSLVDLVAVDECRERKDRTIDALADVLTAVGFRQSFVPYKNSALTHMLQSSLRVEGRTLVLVALRPEESSFGDSLAALRFASHISQNDMGVTRPVNDVSEQLLSIAVLPPLPAAPPREESPPSRRGSASGRPVFGKSSSLRFSDPAIGRSISALSEDDNAASKGRKSRRPSLAELLGGGTRKSTLGRPGQYEPLHRTNTSGTLGTSMSSGSGPGAKIHVVRSGESETEKLTFKKRLANQVAEKGRVSGALRKVF